MASILKVDKLDPQSGTALELGTSGDTISVPSGATLDISASTLTPPATMPASSGINFTALNATNLGSGTVPTARLGTGTASSSTVLYGDQTYKTEPAGGLIEADVWNLTTQFTGSATPIDANLTRMAHTVCGCPLGTGMTESSGIFTFPSTGYWLVKFKVDFWLDYSYTNKAAGAFIKGTVNDATYTTISGILINQGGFTSGIVETSGVGWAIIDVTDVANVKVRFDVVPTDTTNTITYGTGDGMTQMMFIRLGDT